jgi:hypothetical protein
MIRELLGSLFRRRSLSAEEVVFEPLDDPVSETASPEATGRSIAVEKILKQVPAAWRQPGGNGVHEMLVLSPEALLAGEDPHAPRISLRYLARFYPSTFRDPGVMEPDPGVSLAEEDLQNPALGLAHPEVGLAALPPDTVSEVVADPATFSEWEGDRAAGPHRRQEERETRRALRGVRLPAVQGGAGANFDATLSQTAEEEESRERESARQLATASGQSGATAASDSKSDAPNLRLRRILAAYAETLPEFASAPTQEPVSVPKPISDPIPPGTVQPAAGTPAGSSRSIHIPLTRGAGSADGSRTAGEPAQEASGRDREARGESGSDVIGAQRFAELESSLGRFTQVSGYALWERGAVAYSGRLGFDPQQPGVREELEKLLLSGARFGGGGDAFSSLTFHSAQGGFSVFGAGDCVVVVAHRGGEGISEGLRGWLCGWLA